MKLEREVTTKSASPGDKVFARLRQPLMHGATIIAPAGSRFEDGDRAAGVFGVLSTGFAILLGFVIFLAFESYDTSRAGADSEARIVAHQFETVQYFPAEARRQLSGELV